MWQLPPWPRGILAAVLAVSTAVSSALPAPRPLHQTLWGGASLDGDAAAGLSTGAIKPFTRWIPALKLSRTGVASLTQISRQAMAQELRCPLRDLRLVDPSFPGVYPAIASRRSAIILSMLQVKAIIRADEVLLFNPDSHDAQEIAHAVQQQLNTTAAAPFAPSAAPAPSASNAADTSDPTAAAAASAAAAAAAAAAVAGANNNHHQAPMPFEQMVMETCLTHICHGLFARVQRVSVALRHVLLDLRNGASLQARLDQLLPIKNELNEMQYALSEVCKCINDVLTNDDDMARMYLTEASSGHRRSREHHEEVEMMFENYLMQAEVLACDIREYQNEIRNTEEIVEIELDVMRNRILKYELVLSLSSFAVGAGALVTGMFGMNLLSHVEQNPHLFWTVSVAIVGGIALSLGTTLRLLRNAQVL